MEMEMRDMRIWLLSTLVLCLSAASAACTAAPGASSTTPPAGFTDPFAYCAAVGTIDSPDARYMGPTVPDEIINGFKKAAGLEASSEPSDVFKKTTIWRCMAGKVYACNFGANLPCDSKADTNKVPTQEMMDYCTANPGSDFIPMSVTGHATVYSWRCTQAKAELVQQIATVDAQGYLASIWYLLQPNP